MFEKVNPSHPDKLADRIAGAIVDLAYAIDENPRIAVEVLIGHGECHITAETSVWIPLADIDAAVERIAGHGIKVTTTFARQDAHLAANQDKGFRCGDNGIFKGAPVTEEQRSLTLLARRIYARFPTDGKYILADGRLIVCQSNASYTDLLPIVGHEAEVNPIGDWTGGPDVDTGATNRKLGSDMGDGVTGGGLHGKDLSKADVSVNIYAHLLAQVQGRPVEMSCAIGDKTVNGIPYEEIVQRARDYIQSIGGFEKFAEWGLIRPGTRV